MLIRGLYSVFLSDWFKVIPRDQFLVLENKDLQTNRVATLETLAQFLGTGTAILMSNMALVLGWCFHMNLHVNFNHLAYFCLFCFSFHFFFFFFEGGGRQKHFYSGICLLVLLG